MVSLVFDYHLTNPNPAFHHSHLASIPLPPSPAAAVSFPPLAHLGYFPSYLYKYLVTNQQINLYLLLLFPPSTHFVSPCRLVITTSLVVCSVSLFKLCTLFLPINLLYSSFFPLSLFLSQPPSAGIFLSTASHSNFCSSSFSSCSISRSRLDRAPIKKQASKNPLGLDFNDFCSLPFRNNRKKEKRHNWEVTKIFLN